MNRYEYKVVPAPAKGEKARGLKGAEDRFAFAIERLMNDMAAQGWDYQRAETLPSEERSGLASSQTVWRNLLVFRREVTQGAQMPAPSPAPAVVTAPAPVAAETPAPAPAPRIDPPRQGPVFPDPQPEPEPERNLLRATREAPLRPPAEAGPDGAPPLERPLTVLSDRDTRTKDSGTD